MNQHPITAACRDVTDDWGPYVGPLVAATEVDTLAAAYGAPLRRLYLLPANDYLFYTRQEKMLDRRGEVGICLRRPNGNFLLHTKDLYPGLYRLPTGGIHWHEGVEEAVHREMHEETGLALHNLRFLAVIGYEMHLHDYVLPFVTYLWYAEEAGGTLRADGVEVAGFSELPLSSFAWIARQLRATPAPRLAWGAWRAIAHDIAYELLTSP